MNPSILKAAVGQATMTALYVVAVSMFLFYVMPQVAGPGEDSVLAPIAMLLLLVVSAAVTGYLVLGRSVMWYVDGKKKDAVALLGATIGFLTVITVVAFAGLAMLP